MCGKCDRPICTRCMVPGPAGTRCSECASLRASHLYKVNPLHIGLQSTVGVVSGIIGALLVDQIGVFGFFIFFLAPAYGAAVAELMQRIIGRKQGTVVEIVGVGTFLAGGILPVLNDVHHFGPAIFLGDWRQLLGIGLAAGACYSRLRYF